VVSDEDEMTGNSERVGGCVSDVKGTMKNDVPTTSSNGPTAAGRNMTPTVTS
jgi:hypothetical protein